VLPRLLALLKTILSTRLFLAALFLMDKAAFLEEQLKTVPGSSNNYAPLNIVTAPSACLYTRPSWQPRGRALWWRDKDRCLFAGKLIRCTQSIFDVPLKVNGFSKKLFAYLTVQILKILFRGFYSEKSDSPHKIMRNCFYPSR